MRCTTVTSESDTERCLAGQEASTATSVILVPALGNRVYDSNRSVPFRAYTRHHGEILCYGNDIQSRRERGYEQPALYNTLVYCAKIEHMLVRR